MITIKYYAYRKIIVIILLLAPSVARAQTSSPADDFSKFVSKTYRVPEELKYNCEWMYAIVRMKTDGHNKVVKYEFVNEPPNAMKQRFDFLIGYQFPKEMKINYHPVVFYFTIDNSDACKPKDGEQRFYAPNRVVEIISGHLTRIMRDDPHTIIIPHLIMEKVIPAQE